MDDPLWTAVDDYIGEHLIGSDVVLAAALRASSEANLPAIQVAPNQGKLLHLLAKMCGAGRILEVGTLGGYSTIWLARALPPGGTLITLEVDPKHAAVATSNLNRSGLGAQVTVLLGPALDSLAELVQRGEAPFDFIFIDADKPNSPAYLEWAIRLSRPGTVIVVDNVIRQGAVIDAGDREPSVQGSRRLFDLLAAEPRLDATALQTVGSKGYDGFCLAIVKPAA